MAKKNIQTNLLQESITKDKQDVILVKNIQNKSLSKEQNEFNKLSLKIESLRKEIEKNQIELDAKLEVYNNTVLPIQNENVEIKAKFLKFIHQIHLSQKFTKKQSGMIETFIATLFTEIVTDIEMDAELKAIHDYYNTESFDEIVANESKEQLGQFASFLKNEMGIDVDFEGIDVLNFSAEDQARLQARIAEAMQAKYGEDVDIQDKFFNRHNTDFVNDKKKTKAQLKQEALEKEKEELKSKNLRTIYLSLAKVLHPDLEIDEVKKLEKEELMKKVTQAYDNKDLTTLLKLEMEWVNNVTENLANIGADKMKVFIQLLKEQVKELEVERRTILQNERYEVLQNHRLSSLKTFKKDIKYESYLLKEETELFEESIFDVKHFKANKSQLLETIEGYLMEQEMNNFDEYDFIQMLKHGF